jgi:amino acid transporter
VFGDVTALYLLLVVALHRALSTDGLARAAAPAAQLGARLAGVSGSRVLVALVATSTFGACLIGLVSGTRVVAALGDDAQWLRALGRVDGRGVPAAATVVTVGLAHVLQFTDAKPKHWRVDLSHAAKFTSPATGELDSHTSWAFLWTRIGFC